MYQLGGVSFPTKKAITEYFQKYHSNHPVGTILSGEVGRVMIDLFKRHPNKKDKSTTFKITQGMHGFKNYSYLRNDHEQWVCFSYLKCIKGASQKDNHRFNVINAARLAVKPQIRAFRKSKRTPDGYQCDVCLEYFEQSGIDIDHDFRKLTFKMLLDRFAGDKYDNFATVSKKYGHEFVNPRPWERYHALHAILRCLCRDCHQNKKVRVDDFDSDEEEIRSLADERLTFGKYSGWSVSLVAKVDISYLRWLYTIDRPSPEIKAEIAKYVK